MIRRSNMLSRITFNFRQRIIKMFFRRRKINTHQLGDIKMAKMNIVEKTNFGLRVFVLINRLIAIGIDGMRMGNNNAIGVKVGVLGFYRSLCNKKIRKQYYCSQNRAMFTNINHPLNFWRR